MDTLLKVQEELGASIILIGHDMGLMAQVVDRVGIMYAGNLAEVSPVRDLFRAAAPSLQPAADRQPAVAGREGRVPGHPRSAALAAQPAGRLLLPLALPAAPWTAAPWSSRSCARSSRTAASPATSIEGERR